MSQGLSIATVAVRGGHWPRLGEPPGCCELWVTVIVRDREERREEAHSQSCYIPASRIPPVLMSVIVRRKWSVQITTLLIHWPCPCFSERVWMTVIYFKLGGCSRSGQVRKEGGLDSLMWTPKLFSVKWVSTLGSWDLVKSCVMIFSCQYLRALIVFRVNKVCYNMLFQDTRENGFSDLNPRQK